MRYLPVGGAEVPVTEIPESIAGQLVVAGHSLGSALATYLAHDLAPLLGDRLTARLFASPRPGDTTYGHAYMAAVPDTVAYAYLLDLVPRVPFGLSYAALPATSIIHPDTAEAKIRLNPACWHHLLSYASMMNYGLLDWRKVPTEDQSLASCIGGPRLPATA
jgi:hypothetical protein